MTIHYIVPKKVFAAQLVWSRRCVAFHGATDDADATHLSKPEPIQPSVPGNRLGMDRGRSAVGRCHWIHVVAVQFGCDQIVFRDYQPVTSSGIREARSPTGDSAFAGPVGPARITTHRARLVATFRRFGLKRNAEARPWPMNLSANTPQ